MSEYTLNRRPFRIEKCVGTKVWKIPTLKFLAGNRFSGSIADAVWRKRKDKGLWKEPQWKAFKTLLFSGMPIKILEELLKNQVLCRRFDYLSSECPECSRFSLSIDTSWQKKLVEIKQEQGGRFLLWWLFFNDSQEKSVESQQDVPTDELLEFLSSVETPLESFLVDSSHILSLHLEAVLRCQTRIRHLSLMSDSTFACKVISKHCHLQTFNFLVNDSSANMISNDTQKLLLKLLKSQSNSLKELSLIGRKVDLIFEETMFDLWSVLSSMPNLTKLQWAGHPLRHLAKFKTVLPLKCVTCLTLTVGHFKSVCFIPTFDETFPNLVELHVNMGTYKQTEYSSTRHFVNNFKKVTTLKCLSTLCQIRYHPFALLNHLDNVKAVTLEEQNVKISPQKFEGDNPFENLEDLLIETKGPTRVWQNLSELVLFFPKRKITFDEFVFLFKSFPNLISLSCHFYNIDAYDENVFCKLILRNKLNFAKLKTFKIKFDVRTLESMTGKTLIHLLQHSNIEMIENLFSFNLSEQDTEAVTKVAESRGLSIVNSLKSTKNRWICCSSNLADHSYA